MLRSFTNPHQLRQEVIAFRVRALDIFATIQTAQAPAINSDGLPIPGQIAYYVYIESTLTSQQIEGILATPQTANEAASLARFSSARGEAALASQLRTLTPQQAVDYIETNVTNLASAKAVLKIMARILIAMRDQVWPDLPE